MNKNTLISLVISIIVVSLLFYIFLYDKNDDVETFSLHNYDSNISWETNKLVGINKEETLQKIISLEEKLGTSNDSLEKYEILVSIANQYKYLGDGKESFKYLNRAIEVIPKKSLAYMNIGALLSELRATTSAKVAFEEGLLREPQFAQNHLAILDYYIYTDGIDVDEIDNAFMESIEYTNGNENILKKYAQWNEDIGNIKMAIDVWNMVLDKNPKNKDEIEIRIKSLKENAI